jgi:S1-C subfamily serine protease
MIARGLVPGYSFEAAGSPRYVAAATAGAALGAAIGTAVSENQNFNDCMEARGWRIADGPPSATTGAGPMTATLATPVAYTAPVAAVAPRRELGLAAVEMTDALASASQLPAVRGVYVGQVQPGGAAAAAGIQPRDVILSFGSASVASVDDMKRALAPVAGGSVVSATLWRDGREISTRLSF